MRTEKSMTATEPRLSDKELMERTLREMPAFAAWPSVAMSRLLAFSRLQWHTRGDLLSDKASGPEILTLVSGSVLHTRPSEGNAGLTWTLLGPGVLLGFAHMLELEARPFEYIASDDAVAIHIPGHQLFALLDSDPTRWTDMGHMLISQDVEQGQLTTSQMAGKLSRRVAETLEKLAAFHGTRGSEDGTVHLRLAQHDLASMLRVSRQSANKELAALAASGVIKLKYNAVVILDPVALQSIARPTLAPHATDAVARVSWGTNSLADNAFMERELRAKRAFMSWSFTAMTRLLLSSRVGRHPRGSVVWTDLGGISEYILFISGHTSVGRVSPEGDRFSLLLWGPGDFTYIKPVREEALPTFRHGHFDYVATTDVVAIHMPMALLLEILDSEPMLWKEALLMSERQHVSYTHTVHGQVAGSLQQRVASTVQRLAALHGTHANGEDVVRLQVSQASLAMMLQANRQAVNKELKALAASGVLGLEYNAMTVLDAKALGLIAASPQ